MEIRSAHFLLLALLAYRLLDGSDRGRRIFDLYDQPRVPLVPKPDHDGLLRVVHVPEYPLAFLMEGARRDDPRHVGPPLLRPCHHLRATSGAASAPETWERGISRWLLSAHSWSIPRTWMLRVFSASSTSATAEASSLLLEKGRTCFAAAMMTPLYLRRIASEGLIHRGAWKGNSQKSICRIVHKIFLLARESSPEAGPRRSSNHNL